MSEGLPPPCRFLDKLPAELRNNVYELALCSAAEEENQIRIAIPNSAAQPPGLHLCYARPPSKNLLLTCREIYHEARGIYKCHYRQFWQTTRFFILGRQLRGVRGSSKADQARLKLCANADLENVTRVDVYLAPTVSFKLVEKGGLWLRRAAGRGPTYLSMPLGSYDDNEERARTAFEKQRAAGLLDPMKEQINSWLRY